MAETPSMSEQTTEAWADQLIRAETLIRTKLYFPQVPPNRVVRPRLIDLLCEGVEHSLTLLSAPAGFGKTTLVCEWVVAGAKNLKGKSLPVAWLTLDEHDNEPTRFVTYLLAALSTLDIRVDEKVFSLLRSSVKPMERALTVIINQVAEATWAQGSPLNHGFVLVLDDHHLITEQMIHDGLAFLLTHLPPQMHMVIASRVDPVLPLAQLRARGQLNELRVSDLRFQPEEVKVFLNQKMGLNLSTEVIASLDARTEGWPAGLQLAALSMRDRRDMTGFIQAFTGNHRYIVDYLAEQVLSQQPEPVQAFLMETSILDRLCDPLCNALTGRNNGQEMLDRLERENLFLVPLDDERRWYRYHPLFASFLRERLSKSQPERWPELHRRAAEYYERNGLIAEAVDHVLTVGDAQQAADLVEQIAEEIWMSGDMIRLLGWLEALPDEMIRSRPRLCIFHAWILNILGEFEATGARLAEAQARLEQDFDASSQELVLTRGMLATTRAIIAIMEGDADLAVQLSRQAMEDLPEDNWVWRSVVTRNLGNAYLLTGQTAAASQAFREAFQSSQKAGNIYMAVVSLYELAELQMVQGQLKQAARTCCQALELVEERNEPGLTIIGAVHVGMSDVLREWNDLEGGIRYAQTGIELGLRGRSIGVQVCGYARLALLYQSSGDDEAAAQAFQRAAQLVPLRRRTSFIPHHDIQSKIWGRQGSIDLTLHWAQENGLLDGLEPVSEINYMNEAANITVLRLLLALQRPREASMLAERMRVEAERAGRMGRLIEILILQAVSEYAQENMPQALAALQLALELAEPNGYRRIFLDEGEAMRQLLLQTGKQKMRSAVKKYVAALIGAFDRPARNGGSFPSTGFSPGGSQAQEWPEQLSEREMEVLRLVAAGLTNQEVARRLIVAPSTVNWHIKNIYSKLDVHSRTQAVARANELGFLM